LFVADQKSTLNSTSAFCLQWSNLQRVSFSVPPFTKRGKFAPYPLYIYVSMPLHEWIQHAAKFCHHCDHLQSHCFLSSFDLVLEKYISTYILTKTFEDWEQCLSNLMMMVRTG
jgi:hypothetical protein